MSFGGFKVPKMRMELLQVMAAMISQSRFNLFTFFSVASPVVVGKKSPKTHLKINQCQAKA